MLLNTIKNFKNIKYYTGLHPKMKDLKEKYKRPTEFGHKVWDTSFILMDFLKNSSHLVENKSIIEVGCGWGLLGIYLAKSFNCRVTCSDLDKMVLPIAQAHAELNEVMIKTKSDSFASITNKSLVSTQVLVGVEVCYSDEATDDLIQLIDRAYTHKVETILIADPGRPGFLDDLCSNFSGYNKTIHQLPGTKNGKVTYLLHLNLKNS